MNLSNQDEKAFVILAKLASNEESAAKLYQKYADAFPTLREFWRGLASEEIYHASCIRSLKKQVEALSAFVDEDRFNPTAIQTFTDYLGRELSRLDEQEIPLIEALSITFYIEQSLIESKFFEVFKTDSAEVRSTLTKIRDQTAAHRNRVKEILEKHKKTS
jgi:rubrerythrin